MKGAGHFAFGFLLAYGGLLAALHRWPTIQLRLYGPFLPFAIGAFAAAPYAALTLGWTGPAPLQHPAWNLFLFYLWIEHLPGVSRLLNGFHTSAGLVAAAYAHLAVRYINLVRQAGSGHAE